MGTRHSAGSNLTSIQEGEIMPFKSQKQRAWMYANDPAMAKRWQKETPKKKRLPKRVKRKKRG
jgi:hypothetical protein